MLSSLGGMYILMFIFILKKNEFFAVGGKMSTHMWVKNVVLKVQGENHNVLRQF